MLDQSKTLSLTVQLNGTDLQVSPFLKFKPDSEIQTYISQMPRELTHLKYLPQNAFLNGEMQFQKEMFIELDTNNDAAIYPFEFKRGYSED